MTDNGQVQTYRAAQVMGLSQRELIVMLYRGAIRFLGDAKAAYGSDRVDRACEALQRARKIVLHLCSTLDLEAGGEIAGKLSSLYAYVVELICVANARRDIGSIDTAMELMTTLKDAWDNIPDVSPGAPLPEAIVGSAVTPGSSRMSVEA